MERFFIHISILLYIFLSSPHCEERATTKVWLTKEVSTDTNKIKYLTTIYWFSYLRKCPTTFAQMSIFYLHRCPHFFLRKCPAFFAQMSYGFAQMSSAGILLYYFSGAGKGRSSKKESSRQKKIKKWPLLMQFSAVFTLFFHWLRQCFNFYIITDLKTTRRIDFFSATVNYFTTFPYVLF